MSTRTAVRGPARIAVLALVAVAVAVAAVVGLRHGGQGGSTRVAVAGGSPSSSASGSAVASPGPDARTRLGTALTAVPSHGVVRLGAVEDACPGCTGVRLRRAVQVVARPDQVCPDAVAVGALVPVRADARVTWTASGVTRSYVRGVRQTTAAADLMAACRRGLAAGTPLVASAPLDASVVGVPGALMSVEVRPAGRTPVAGGPVVVTVTFTAG